jgi:hypothetical protein
MMTASTGVGSSVSGMVDMIPDSAQNGRKL